MGNNNINVELVESWELETKPSGELVYLCWLDFGAYNPATSDERKYFAKLDGGLIELWFSSSEQDLNDGEEFWSKVAVTRHCQDISQNELIFYLLGTSLKEEGAISSLQSASLLDSGLFDTAVVNNLQVNFANTTGCSPYLFKMFEDNVEKHITLSGDSLQFAQENWGDANFSGKHRVEFPTNSAGFLQTWEAFEEFCANIFGVSFSLNLAEKLGDEYIRAMDNGPPSSYFDSEESAKKVIASCIDETGAKCVEVANSEKRLFIVYLESDYIWCQGEGDKVLVLENLEDLNERYDFYDC